jgi:TolB protein
MTAAGADDRAMSYSSLTISGLSRRRLIMLSAGVAVGTGLAARRMAAALEADVNQAVGQPLRIALPQFIQVSASTRGTVRNPQVALEMTHVIASNLRHTGRFAPIDPAAYRGRSITLDAIPQFDDWRALDAQALVIGRLTGEPDERLRAEFRIWDVPAGQHLLGQMYVTTWDSWRRLAHIVSDAIYERFTGQKGIFDAPEAETIKP